MVCLNRLTGAKPSHLPCQQLELGFCVGSIPFGSPTYVDDIALLAKFLSELRSQTLIVEHFTRKNRFNINGGKSNVLAFNLKTALSSIIHLQPTMSYQKILFSDSTEHLGLLRKTATSKQIDVCIKRRRSATHSLMGAGLHGVN